MTTANVTKATTIAGTYCIHGLSFTARSVMVAAQTGFDGGQPDVIVTAYLADGTVSGPCSGKILVRTHDVSDAALADRPFMIWLEE